MKVDLIAYTPNPLNVIWRAYRQCKTPTPKYEPEKNKKQLAARCIKSGHLSPLEHVSFTFSVSDISRAASHQLVRHRLASYSQLSQREHSPENFVVPPEIAKRKELADAFQYRVEAALTTYQWLLDQGIEKEDARYILPQAMVTSLMMTMNCRELLLFFKARCCEAAQWEIRQLANEIRGICENKLPEVFCLPEVS